MVLREFRVTLPGVMYGSSSMFFVLGPCHSLPGTNSSMSSADAGIVTPAELAIALSEMAAVVDDRVDVRLMPADDCTLPSKEAPLVVIPVPLEEASSMAAAAAAEPDQDEADDVEDIGIQVDSVIGMSRPVECWAGFTSASLSIFHWLISLDATVLSSFT